MYIAHAYVEARQTLARLEHPLEVVETVRTRRTSVRFRIGARLADYGSQLMRSETATQEAPLGMVLRAT